MSTGLIAVLVGLSLVDSTSFGTLLIPIWLLLAPGRVRAGRIAVYLGTVAAFYLVVGLTLAAGAATTLTAARSLVTGVPDTPLRVAQLATGIALVALSYWLEARIRRRDGRSGRLQAWRARAVSDSGPAGARSLMVLAILATGIEVVTMLPYLAAIGLLTAAAPGPAVLGAALAAYCLVMVAPAVVLTALRIVWHSRVDPLLTRINSWFERNNAKAVGWTVGGIGIGVGVNAIINLAVQA